MKETALGACAHQDLPFEMLVEKLQPECDLTRNPLFQTIFQLLNQPGLAEFTVGEAALLAAMIPRHPALELFSEPETNIVLYRYLPQSLRRTGYQAQLSRADLLEMNSCNERLQSVKARVGLSFVLRTTIFQPLFAGAGEAVGLRAVLTNPLVTEADFEAVLCEQVAIADVLCAAKEHEQLQHEVQL